MRSGRASRGGNGVAWLSFLLLLGGCGGGETDSLFHDEPIRCGPGTIERAGQCVPEPSDGGELPDVSEVPDSEPADGADGSAGEDDAGEAGEGDDDASVDAADAEGDGPGKEPDDSGAADDSGDGGAVVPGDPCPDVPMVVNCSDTCDSRNTTEECSRFGCAVWDTFVTVSSLPAAIRLPTASLTSCKCQSEMIILQLNVYREDGYPRGIRVRVPEPWGFSTSSCTMVSSVQCISGSSPLKFWLMSDEPNPPPRNLIIEEVLAAGECP